MYLKSSRPSSSSAPRPTKRRRRTATAVLAGHFDPRPERDFFTDMANSNDTQNPYSSVIGHGPGILFDVRSQEEKDAELAREQKRLVKNAKRKERDLEKRREKEEQKFKKAQKRADRLRENAQAKTASRTDEVNNMEEGGSAHAVFFGNPSGIIPPPISFARGAAAQAPLSVPAFLPPLQAGPSSGYSPYYRTPQGLATYSSEAPLISGHRMTSSPAVPLQSATAPQPEDLSAPTAPSLTISVPHRLSAILPVSPPTPSRSISSCTSRTSSKRPRTPDDDDVPFAQMHTDNENAFQMYSPLNADGELHTVDTDIVERTTRGKRFARPTSPNHDLHDRDPATATASPVSSRAPLGPPAWIESPLPPGGTQSRGDIPWMTVNPIQPTSSEPSSAFVGQTNEVRTSTSHRRSALSLAALLSPPSVHYALSRPIPAIPATPNISAPEEPRPNYQSSVVGTSVDQLLEPSVDASSTVESSCLSPLAHASPVSGDAVSAPVVEFQAILIEDARESSPDGPPLASLRGETGEPTDEAVDDQRSDSKGYEIQMDLDLDSAVAHVEDHETASQREESTTPESSGKDNGRRSKAMLVIQSEDELTDLDDLDATFPSPKVGEEETNLGRPASMSLPGVSASREPSLAGGRFSVPASSASPSVNGNNAAPQRRKRQAAKKGWKGWIEVEVEEEHDIPARRFNLDAIPSPTLGERRTRSGRHFDA